MRPKPIVSAAVVALLVLSLFVLYREAILHGFSAREEPWAIEEFVARHLRSLATGTETKTMANPFAPSPEILADARDHFADHCAICHGDDGSGKTDIGEGLYPPPPDLREAETQGLSDGEIFAIIRNGIRFTGMPAWGGEDTDESIWQLVVFVRHLPHLSSEELEHMQETKAQLEERDSHEH